MQAIRDGVAPDRLHVVLVMKGQGARRAQERLGQLGARRAPQQQPRRRAVLLLALPPGRRELVKGLRRRLELEALQDSALHSS